MNAVIIIGGCILLGKIIRKAQQKRRIRAAMAASSSAPALFVPSAALRAEQRAIEQKQKEEKRRAMEEQKAREKAEKLEAEKHAAEIDLEYIRHRLQQVYKLIKITEDNQLGTLEGGKEWMKYQKQLMTYEAQAHTLKKKEQKAMAIRNRMG